ncbi:hypothetical protein GCM10020295_10870 [Streptomyces cinereospinus]
MGDEELVAHEVDVGLDAAEAVVEGVEERPGMLVVVVRVGAPQRPRERPRSSASALAPGRATAPAKAAPRVVRALRRVVRAMVCLPGGAGRNLGVPVGRGRDGGSMRFRQARQAGHGA